MEQRLSGTVRRPGWRCYASAAVRVGLVIAVGVAPCRAEAMQAAASGAEGRAIDAAVPTAVPWRAEAPPPAPRHPRVLAREYRFVPRPAAVKEPRRGTGMIIAGGALIPAGGLMIGLGLLVRALSTGCLADCSEDTYRRKPSGGEGLFAVGGVIIATGIVLVAVGISRHEKWRRWKKQQVAAPTVSRTALGTWSAGVALRF